jgi:hydrogenase/urease accessory protein HupE
MTMIRALRLRSGFFFTFLACACLARAHDPFSSIGRAEVAPAGIHVELTMARSMATALFKEQKGLPDEITEENFERFYEPLRTEGAKLFVVTAGKNSLAATESDVELSDETDVTFHLVFPGPTQSPLRFRARYLEKMPNGHVGTLSAESAAGKDLGWSYLDSLAPTLEVPLPANLLAVGANSNAALNATNAAASEKNLIPSSPPFRAFLKLGIEHILTGYDHLLFLAGLLIACRRFSTMAGIITCFTIAHSLTLALAALDVVTLPSRVVEPLIAASIVFVGIENLARRGEEPRGRWLLTFGFGLVHGFGFAGALKAAGLGSGGAALAIPLFGFNLGVEIGQIAVAAILLPIIFQLRRRPNFIRYGLPVASSVVVLLGGYWLLQRTVLS